MILHQIKEESLQFAIKMVEINISLNSEWFLGFGYMSWARGISEVGFRSEPNKTRHILH